jgi:hypothetical protein
MIQNSLRQEKGIELLFESPKEAYIQAVLARGDRRLSQALFIAVQNGGSKAFKRAIKESSLDENFYLYHERSFDEVLPWQSLHMGFDISYLILELSNAKKEEYTMRCKEGCKRCGVCE